MARLTPLHLIPALIASAAPAGEITVELRPFSVEKSFTAIALPSGESLPLHLDPKSWADFKILKLTDHGTRVAKGDVLVSFDPEAIDKKLEDARRAVESGVLTLAQAELDAKNLQETASFRLEAVRRAAEIAKEENSYFTLTKRKAGEEAAQQELKRSEQMLSNQREELRQLSKMYEADDVTEETEEIILVRQQDAVAAAEFALRMEMLDHKRTLEVILPRQAKTLADSERDTAMNLKKAELDIPRAIELGKVALESLRTTTQRAKNDLSELEADRKLFEIKAPADGWFYHGAIENGRWTTGEILKVLVPQGHVPANKTFATFVPATAKLGLTAFLDDPTSRSLKPELSGIATLAGREDLEIPVKLTKIAPVPTPEGTYRADLAVTWPKDVTPMAGVPVQVKMVAYQQPTAIVIPNKALNLTPAGWTVEVKLADGKTEPRPVKRGRVSAEEAEILSGLEPGQVIVVP